PIRAVLDGGHETGHVLLPLEQAGVTGVLIVGTERLDETDARQLAVRQISKELGFVLEMRSRTRVRGIQRAVRIERRVVSVISKRLVVELEERVGLSGQRVIPAARVPAPADTRGTEPVADIRRVVRLRRIVVVDRVE